MKKQDKSIISNNESDLFRSSMKDVTPLTPSNKIPPAQAKPIKKSNSQQSQPLATKAPDWTQAYFNDIPSDDLDNKIEAHSDLFFQRAGIQHALMKRLKKGLIARKQTIDLHGLNVEQANVELFNFLETYTTSMQTCICLIHGKGTRSHLGKPVLKQKINQWLKQHPRVIAFCSALPQDGGTGATYVLIKRNN